MWSLFTKTFGDKESVNLSYMLPRVCPRPYACGICFVLKIVLSVYNCMWNKNRLTRMHCDKRCIPVCHKLWRRVICTSRMLPIARVYGIMLARMHRHEFVGCQFECMCGRASRDVFQTCNLQAGWGVMKCFEHLHMLEGLEITVQYCGLGGKLPSFPRFPWRFPSRSVSGCSPSPQSLLAFQAMGIAGTGEPEPILSLLFQLQVEGPFQFRQNVSSSLSLSPLTKTFVYWVHVIFMQFMHIYANADPRMT